MLKIFNEGKKLGIFLDDLQVSKKWLPKMYIDWFSGEQINEINPQNSFHSHCSAFVSSVCSRLKIPIIGPEFNVPTEGLANVQYQWLNDYGKIFGWTEIIHQNYIIKQTYAQVYANKGHIVIVCYYNTNDKNRGHIAIIKPCQITPIELLTYGPLVCQAGKINSSSIYLNKAFYGKDIDLCRFWIWNQ